MFSFSVRIEMISCEPINTATATDNPVITRL